MFTGIVEAVGKTVRTRSTGQSARLVIDLGPVSEGVVVGDSVAVNGACLTAASISGAIAEFDVSRETLKRTTLGELRAGARVNLERALRVGDRLGGHFVLGHVDAVGTISAMDSSPGQLTLEIIAASEIISRLVSKGSIAVSGMSLTVASITADRFAIAIIPHTIEHTNLLAKFVGGQVNLELDVIGKYIERLLALREGREPPADSSVSKGFLAEHGFV